MDQGNRSAKAQMENDGTVTRTNTADELERLLGTDAEDTNSESSIEISDGIDVQKENSTEVEN